MRLLTYRKFNMERLGILVRGQVYDLQFFDPALPAAMLAFLQGGKPLLDRARAVELRLLSGDHSADAEQRAELLAPLPRPASCRDGYAFRQHVEAARRNRGLAMIPEFDHYPVLYFSNHHGIQGPGPVSCMPDHFEKLDFELEVAVIIGKRGRNIRAVEADSFIAGYTIMNDISARTLQMEEMLLNLGPAKGKDFATVIGPWLVTPDELAPRKVAPKPGHSGRAHDLDMSCCVNGKPVSQGNMADMDWTFAELIERASYGCDLYPGDVIGSGTVGTGCFLELNGTGLRHDPAYPVQWLQEGDTVELNVTGLGTLKNTITREEAGWSILGQKKQRHENL